MHELIGPGVREEKTSIATMNGKSKKNPKKRNLISRKFCLDTIGIDKDPTVKKKRKKEKERKEKNL